MLELLLFGQKTGPAAFFDLRSGSIPAGATFTRGSTGWYFNNAGVLTSAGTDVARFPYDPVTLAPLGYLSEAQSTNGFRQSGDLSNASWPASGITATGAAALAPDGTNAMALLVESAATGAHRVSQSITLASGAVAGISGFVKAKERSKFYLRILVSANNYATAIFDTAGAGTTASQTSVGSGSGTIVSTDIHPVGGGIYRISMLASVTGANPTAALGLASLATGNTVNTNGDVSYTGDGVSGAYAWGAQFETRMVSSYIPTLGSAVTRATDILTVPLASVPGWQPSTGGVLVLDYALSTSLSTACVAALCNTDFTHSVALYENFSGAGNAKLNTAGASSIQLVGAATPAPGVRRTTAIGWGPTQQIAHDGVLDATGAGQIPTGLTFLRIGTDDGSNALGGTVRGVRYYAAARSNDFVQQVSRPLP